MLNSIFSTAIVLVPAAYLAIGFALHLAACWNRTAIATPAPIPAPAPVQEEVIATTPAPVEAAIAPASAPTPTPSVEAAWAEQAIAPQPQPNWQAMSPADLRKACQAAGIKWRNAIVDGDKKRHLRKAEMVAALAA